MARSLASSDNTPASLMARVSDATENLQDPNEEAWVEVIQQMDRVYAELIEAQTALEEKNEELENTQDFISSVMQAMSDLMIVCGRDGQILQVNAALEKLTGLGSEVLIGRPLSDVLTGSRIDAQNELHEHIAAKRSINDCEVFVIGAGGDQVPLSVNCSVRYDALNQPAGVVLIGRPMGELQRAYRELDDALKNFGNAQQHLISSEKMAALGRLVAGVAHELNNPISFVFGNMHALKSYGEKITRFLLATDENLSVGEMRRLREELQIDRIAKDILPLVEGTLEGAERVSDIVQDLRRFSGNQSEPLEEVALCQVIETAAKWVLRGARRAPEISFDCLDDCRIVSKKGHIHQILVNLVQNAIDALSDVGNPMITISSKSNSEGVSVSIRDNGPGIPSKHMSKIFEPFFTTKPVGKGTGLGLYVSYRMADEIGAQLSVCNPGQAGACFTLQLPRTPASVIS